MKKLNSKLTSNKANYKRLFAMMLIGAFCFNCIRYISASPGSHRDFRKDSVCCGAGPCKYPLCYECYERHWFEDDNGNITADTGWERIDCPGGNGGGSDDDDDDKPINPDPNPDPTPEITYSNSTKPIVDNVTTDSRYIKGKSASKSKIKVKYNGNEIGTTTSDSNGRFSVAIPENIKPKVGDTIVVNAKDPDGYYHRYFAIDSDPKIVTGFDSTSTGVQTDLTAKDIADMEAKIKLLTKNLNISNEKIITLEKTIEKLKDSHQKEVDKYEEIIKRLKDERTDLLKEINYLTELLKEKELKIKELTERLADLNKKIAELENKIKELEKQIADLTKENQSLKDQIKNLLDRIKQLESDLSTCKADNADKQKEIDKLKKELADLKKETDKIIADKTKSENEKQALIDKLKDKISELELKIRKVIDLKIESDRTKDEEIDKLKEKLLRLNKKLKNKDRDSKEYKYFEYLKEKLAELENGKGRNDENYSHYDSTSSQGNSDLSSGSTTMNGSEFLNGGANRFGSDETKEDKIRHPNKLVPKNPPQNNTDTDEQGRPINKNKGVPSKPTKARATVIENVNNSNEDYPIHKRTHQNGSNAETTLSSTNEAENDKYSADARQFVTFKTKSGKTFHLIIDHDAKEENVQLLTEVSEDDLLNVTAPESTELKPTEAPKPEQTEPVKEEPKKEEGTSLGTYLLLGLIMVGAVVGGMYYKKYKAQEKADLQSLEDDESDDEITFNESDDYFDEDDSEQSNSSKNSESANNKTADNTEEI